ncbi:MAG TPA: hypothetical protein VF447_00110 [Terriglobales bacterium]
MLNADDIEDIITDLSCRNAAGGIYTGSVHEFARAVEKASRAEAFEEAAKLIEPRNAPDDWTDYAKIRAEAADAVRALSRDQTT